MATPRSACGGSCAVCDVRGERCSCCWRGWRRLFPCCSSTCLPSSSAIPAQTALQPQLPEITLEQLEAIIPIIQREVDRLDPSTASSSSQAPISQILSNTLAQWEDQKQICTNFINSLPKGVAETSTRLFMSILTNTLSGVGEVHWLCVGFTFIAWSLDSINNISQNREDCIGILRSCLRLLQNTKQIWEAINKDNASNEGLQDAVEKAFRCASFCTSTLTDSWILSFFKAPTVKDAIDTFAKELDRAIMQNMEVMLRHNLILNVERQNTIRFLDDEIVGGQDVVQEAIQFLETSSDDIKAICLHGMGGIGKSFLGLKIFTKFQKSKYRDCKVGLQLETKQGELCDIQKQIIEKVCKHQPAKFSSPDHGRQEMEKELKQISVPIFLYVDNVIQYQHLHELLPKASDFPKGSRILITSRGENIKWGIHELGITNITNYKLIQVRKLPKQQARELLWKQFKSEGEHRDNTEVASLEETLLELCDGLPLALTVVGKYIANNRGPKNVEVWREAVDAMQKAEPLDGDVDDPLYSRIRFSIANLDPKFKQAFLDIIFFVDTCKWTTPAEWASVERLVISPRYLEVLSQRVLVVRKREGHRILVEIHDVIKALGKRMVEEDCKNELRITGKDELEKRKNENALEIVVALCHVTVDADLLKRMPRLRLLHHVDVRGECQEIQLRNLRMVNRFTCSTARVFDWSKCESLKVVGWERCPAPSLEVFKHDGKLSRIEALQLSKWHQLKDVDVIETLTGLTTLYLSGCVSLQSIPEGIGSLTGLTELGLRGCESLQSIPEGIGSLTGLTRLDLWGCRSLQSIPEGIGSLTGLTWLGLGGCQSLQSIPEGIGSLTGLTRLDLEVCRSLQSIPEGIGSLTGLTRLDLRGCQSLQSIPEGIGSLTGLTELGLGGCVSLQSIPEGIGSLTGLTRLDLGGCESLQSIPEGIGSLTGLTGLGLWGCQSLQSIPEGIGSLTGLTLLGLGGCQSLQSIPEGIGSLTGLTLLDLRGCQSLQSIPEGIGSLTGLTKLT